MIGGRASAAVLAAVLASLGASGAAGPAAAEPAPQPVTITGGPSSATDATPVTLDADLWLPTTTPAPAVVLAHGFGGSKASVADEAAFLAARGFVVLAYSARGFGASTGRISMNAPAFEVQDARRVVDYLSTLPQVRADGANDPVVGVAGGSYGGALALLLAGTDRRIDAVAADITWNSLERSLFGQSTQTPGPGAYKQVWTAAFFSAGLTSPDGTVTACGRFAPDWCAAYTQAATTGTLSPEGRALMAASSPASVTDRITAPTLLGGGQSDSLFPLSEVNANAEQIRAAHPQVPVKVVWHAGGHDGGVNESDRLRALTAAWMDAHLNGGPAVSTAFEASLVQGSALSDRADASVEVLTAPGYPGITGDSSRDIPIGGPPQHVLAPAAGLPAAISSLPGLGSLAGLASGAGMLPGIAQQTATFVSEPVVDGVRIVGSPQVTLLLSSQTPVEGATLFASLRVIGAGGRQTLPAGLVAPMRLDLGPTPTPVTVELPTIVESVAPGDRLAVVVGTTDQAYRPGPGPTVLTIGLASPSVTVPLVAATTTASGTPAWAWPLGAVLLCLLIALAVRLARPRQPRETDARNADRPIVVTGLAKEFSHGLRAVDGVDFSVPPGVVLGLLGPNGAGKTTTMRMIMGLIRPTGGQVQVFGQTVSPGAPVLARVGSFVEGPGFLPHLSGRANLDLYWRASGRGAEDPHLDEVLEIAGLGSAIDRRVRTYSQGMRQRLGIAQAMLGLPDLLLLDEPANGLDPPQIREMRTVVQEYARSGRTVVISSHLLSEVEQTCTDVIVMHRGRVIASGSVKSLLTGHSGQRLEDVFMAMVGEGHEVSAS